MKKFLSMLLALSVVFTYTFGAAGSVFAAETEAQKIDAKALAQQKVIDDAVQAQLDAVVYGQDGYLFEITTGGPATADQKLLTAAALAEGAKAAKADGEEAIAEEVRKQKLADTYNEGEFEKIKAGSIYNVAAYTYQFNVEKTAKYEEIAKINPSDYVEFDYDPAEGDQSDKATVLANKTVAKDAVDKIKVSDTDKEAAIAKLIGDVKAVAVVTPNTAAQYQENLDKAKTAANTAINGYADTLKATLKATYQGQVNSAATPTDKAAAEAKLNAVDANVAKVANLYLAQVEAVAIDKDTKPGTGAGTVGDAVTNADAAAKAALKDEASLNKVLAQLADVDALVDVAKNKAAALKVERENDGTIKYDSAEVDKALAAVIAKIENYTYATLSAVTSASEWTIVSIKDAAKSLAAYKEDRTKADGAIDKSADESNYATAEQEKIVVLKQAAKDAVEAAADKAAVDAIMAKLAEDIAALPTKTQTNALKDAALTAINTTLDYDAVLARLFDATVYAAPAGTYDEGVKNAIVAAAVNVMVDAVLAQIDAAKAIDTAAVEAVVTANLDAAKAVITGMPTKAAVEAQVADVIAKIDAIPSTVTLEVKATVVAADDAYKALVAVPAYNNLASTKKVPTAKKNNLDAAKTTIQNLEKAVVCDAVKALKDKATLTDADEAAYEAAKALSDAYYDAYTEYASNAYVTANTDLATIKAAIDGYKYEKAAKAIEAIPSTVTLEDKATVEAARAAYDALTAAQKAAFSATLVKKLEAAEAAIVAAENADEAEKALEEAIKAKEEAEKAAADAKEEADKAKQEAADAKEAAEKAEADKIAAEKEAADAKEAADKAAAEAEQAAKDKAAAEAAKAEAEAAQAAAEKALADAQTKIKVMNTTAKVSKATATKTSVKLTFAKPAVGADGYKVYMATSKNGTYKLVGTTTGTTFTKKSLKAGKTYYFKVKAYKTVAGAKVYTKTSAKFAKATAK